MFFLLSKLLYGLAAPLTWVFYPLLYAVLRRRHHRRAVGLAVLLLYLISNDWLGSALMRAWEYPPANLTGQPPYAVAVVLTGGIVGDGSPNAGTPSFGPTTDRLLQALRLYQQGRVQHILISGGQGKVFSSSQLPDEGETSAQFLRACGVPPGRIFRETRSRNTYENAQFSAPWLRRRFPAGRFLLVTSAFHIRRAEGCFRKAGLGVTPYPSDFRAGSPRFSPAQCWPSAAALDRLDRLVHEWLGYLTYRVLGYC